MRPPLTRLTAALCVLFAPIALLAVPAQAQTSTTPVTVTVNSSCGLGVISPIAHGVNTFANDIALLDPPATTALKQMGTNMLRYPGGNMSDDYHHDWNYAGTLPPPGSDGTQGSGVTADYTWVTGNTTTHAVAQSFDNFMTVAQATGASPLITVNYGSNYNHTAGGDPAEAAAWVNYSNNVKHYGVKYWEIGNEPSDLNYEGRDLHTVHGPLVYGQNVALYAAAMKAKDPSILIGAYLTAPGTGGGDGSYPVWNNTVLSQCGSSIDFVIVHYYGYGSDSPNDAVLLGAPANVAGILTRTRALVNQYCGAKASKVQILITEVNSVPDHPSKQTANVVEALFTSDITQTLLENGASNYDFWELHGGMQLFWQNPNPNPNSAPNLVNPKNSNNDGYGIVDDPSLYGPNLDADGGMLCSALYYSGYVYDDLTSLGLGIFNQPVHEAATDSPRPAYWGNYMAALLGGNNDTIVSSATTQPLVVCHAVKRANGQIAMLLINQDPNTDYAATVNIAGYSTSWSAPSATYVYGESNNAIAGYTLTPIIAPAGSTFTQTLPRYSMTTVILSPTPTSPTLLATVSPSQASVAPGGASTLTVSVTNSGAALSGGTVSLQICDVAGTVVAQQSFTNQNFTAGQPTVNHYSWTAPSPLLTYYASVIVTDSSGKTQYYSGKNLAAILVTNDGTVPTVPAFTITATAFPNTVMPGSAVNVTMSYMDTGAALNSAVVNFQDWAIDNPVQPIGGVSWVYGQTQSVTFHWIAPSTIGTYHLGGGVFSSDWNMRYDYNSTAGILNVVSYVAPALTVAGTVDQPSLAPGAMTTIHATATDIGGPLTNGTGFVEVHDPSGKVVATQNIPGLNWNTNQTVAFPPITWTAPGTTGVYTVWVGVKDPSGTPVYAHNSVATINVTPASVAVSGTATPSTVAPGTIVTVSGTATNSGGALTNDFTEIDIYSSSWGLQANPSYSGQSWNTGQSHTYSFPWTASSTPDTYYVYMKVMTPSGSQYYAWQNVATITVTPPAITVANFGFETPGLGNAQYLYRPTGSSWTFATNSGIASNGSAFNNPAAPQGNQVAFIQQQGTISQTLSSGSAGVWTISVSAAQRTNSAQTVNVLLDGTKIGSIKPTSNPFATYTVTSPSSVGAGSHTLTFQGTTTADNTAFIDNVQVTSH